jgi:hypothetical protein
MTFGHVLGTECCRASMFDYQRCDDLWPDQDRYSGAGDENRTRMTSLEVSPVLSTNVLRRVNRRSRVAVVDPC